jgi:superfamily II DNA or RNA helicase
MNKSTKQLNKHNDPIIWPQTLNTYLGQKGYTILKSELPISLQVQLKENLMVKPYVPGSPIQVQKTFPVYRESDNKIYIPRYFGEELFGKVKTSKISEGENIQLTFLGTLRDYQVPIVETYLNHVNKNNGGSGLLELYCGAGKTDLTIHIISRLNKKTLIIVHKEFLMNQWIERINKYYPNARIGKIQGQVIDIDNKDIVLCMLQSLSMKDYPSSLFDSFGFTIIDEVHHISSEVFSCALFKLVTKYMLGLSATMNRKDGTTKVFKMFLGDVVYKLERSKDDNVIVRGITYQTDDDEFNTLELDFRGQTAASKMLSKICNYNRRSEFVLKVLKDMINENPKQQIMIIASYRNILNYFYEAINHHKITTVGYYVGGMKEASLKESESKQVVLATYSMAAEGLDIKTLSTLIMVTPMTNIEQSVGRILRQKHEFAPIVVDIIDTHDNFQRQWIKRKSFYKKNNYKIIQTSSSHYQPDASKWKTTYEPTQKKENSCGAVSTNISSKDSVNLKLKTNSRSSSEKSIAEDTESEVEELSDNDSDNDNNNNEEPKNKKMGTGVCLLKFKK